MLAKVTASVIDVSDVKKDRLCQKSITYIQQISVVSH